jgi:polysaccharide biosynthesis transport protein
MINFSELLWNPKGKTRSSPSRPPLFEETELSPSLGEAPVDEAHIGPDSRLVVWTDPRSPGADRFRYLRMRLGELKDIAKLRTLMITSPLPRDGKSTVILNLATVLAEGGKQSVLVIEADLHHPILAHRLGVEGQAGLSECLSGILDPMMAIRRIEPPKWYLLQAGKPVANPSELLQSGNLATVLQKLSPNFNWILVDTPPVAPLTDAVTISQHVDASLLVVRANHTPRELVEEALNLLGPKHVPCVVLNGAEGLNRLYSRYSGYYGK